MREQCSCPALSKVLPPRWISGSQLERVNKAGKGLDLGVRQHWERILGLSLPSYGPLDKLMDLTKWNKVGRAHGKSIHFVFLLIFIFHFIYRSSINGGNWDCLDNTWSRGGQWTMFSHLGSISLTEFFSPTEVTHSKVQKLKLSSEHILVERSRLGLPQREWMGAMGTRALPKSSQFQI